MPGPTPTDPDAPQAPGRLRAFLRGAHFAKLWRYMSVSILTTFLSLGLLYVFYRKVKVGAVDLNGWQISQAEVANVIATAITTIPSYYLNRAWAWGKSGKSHLWREVVPFWVIAFISLVLSTLVVGLASREAVHLSQRHEVQTILVELGNLATYGVMWLAKYFIFNKVLFVGGERSGREGGDAVVTPLSAAAPHGQKRNARGERQRGESERGDVAELLVEGRPTP